MRACAYMQASVCACACVCVCMCACVCGGGGEWTGRTSGRGWRVGRGGLDRGGKGISAFSPCCIFQTFLATTIFLWQDGNVAFYLASHSFSKVYQLQHSVFVYNSPRDSNGEHLLSCTIRSLLLNVLLPPSPSISPPFSPPPPSHHCPPFLSNR